MTSLQVAGATRFTTLKVLLFLAVFLSVRAAHADRPAGDAPRPPTQTIMFIADTDSDRSSGGVIHLMQPDGSKLRRLATKFAVDGASMSPDGRRIAYVATNQREIRIIDTDGRNDRPLAQTERKMSNQRLPGLRTAVTLRAPQE